jgi:hypothetical protein
MYVCMCVRMYVCIILRVTFLKDLIHDLFVVLHMYVCITRCICIYIHIYIYIYIYIYGFFEQVYKFKSVYVSLLSVYIYMHDVKPVMFVCVYECIPGIHVTQNIAYA